MRIRILALTTLFVLSLVPTAYAADRYEIDLSHSSLDFNVRHLVITKVKGNFTDFSGTILFDEKDIGKSSVEVKVKTASINTSNKDRDNHLRSADFFNAEKYPEIIFKSEKVLKKENGYLAVGNLKMNGVTKKIEIPFTFTGPIKDPWGNTRYGIEGGLTINRQDWKISWNKLMDNGGVVVGNEVEIGINIEAVKK